MYLTYTVTESNDIQGSHLGQFVYQYSQINKILAPENKLDSRINVQSPGVIEFISEYVQAGIYLFILIAIGGITFHGGKLQILGKEFEATGILPRYHKHKQKVQEDELELSRKRLELIEQANELANQLNVPISALGIELPEGLKEKVENNIKAANDEAQKEPNN
ncbi:hypothetical protein HZZ02_01770 [Streptococcus danieliae]|nr:hypothetical protein [Streptococcus danieliae]